MHRLLILISGFLLVFGCEPKTERPADALSTARVFIRSSLDGDYKMAEGLLWKDSINLLVLKELEKSYERKMSKDEKEAFKNSSILIHSLDQVSDSVVIISYSNTYQKKKMPIKVILKDGLWQVDLNYTFSGNL
ncbi:MAG: hypothetical protein KGP35_08015 [Bacteroidetes bacterium]|nr:hypothetical protein [Bacteroidota bacterium]